MKIIKELGSCVKMEDVKAIYDKGNKIAISFKENTCLGYLDTCTDKECINEGILRSDVDLEFKSGIGIVDDYDGIGCLANGDPLVIESIINDKCGVLAEIYPFVGKYSDYGTEPQLYDDSKDDPNWIADKVYEVSVQEVA